MTNKKEKSSVTIQTTRKNPEGVILHDSYVQVKGDSMEKCYDKALKIWKMLK